MGRDLRRVCESPQFALRHLAPTNVFIAISVIKASLECITR